MLNFGGIVAIGVYADLNLPTLGKKMRKRKLPKQRAAMKDERKHLTVLEVEKLLAAIKGAWHEATSELPQAPTRAAPAGPARWTDLVLSLD
jgi:hypothetical protein